MKCVICKAEFVSDDNREVCQECINEAIENQMEIERERKWGV